MGRAYHALTRAEAVIAGAFLLLMVLLIFVGGVARVARMPLNWTTDLATCLFAWACFLAADIAWRNNAMMSIDVFTARLPPRLQAALRAVNYGLIVAFLGYILVLGAYLSWISRTRSFQGIPEVSYSWVTLSLPVGAALLLVTTARKIRDEWRGTAAESRAVDLL